MLAELLHHDTLYAAGSTVLEAGCGVGTQTVILARNNPRSRITSIDVSLVSSMSIPASQPGLKGSPKEPTSR
jgi:trans-aconitate methyltransferase